MKSACISLASTLVLCSISFAQTSRASGGATATSTVNLTVQ